MHRQNFLTIFALFLLLLFLLPVSCSDNVTSSNNDADDKPDNDGEPLPAWLIPVDEVFDGGPGRDGIPALVFPQVANQSEINFMDDDELITAILIGDSVRGYPHQIMDYHEIVNDSMNDISFALTYCPLTGSAIGWNRTLNGATTTFGVSGLLYKNNLIPYDRMTGSNWSQMGLRCVNGSLRGEEPEVMPVLETSWATFKTLFPEASVMTRNTGHSRNYDRYPYKDYRTNDEFILFPTDFDDDRMPAKWRVLGVITPHASRVYPIDWFMTGTSVLNETYDGVNYVVVASLPLNLAVAYNRKLADGTVLEFSAVNDQLPAILTDNEGNVWDVWGRAISGPRTGTKLESVMSHYAYWFAWVAFHPGPAVYPY